MKSGLTPDFILKNQTMVRFTIGEAESVAYSNTVDTPWVGPILKFSKFIHEKLATLNQTITFSLSIQNDGNRDTDITVYDILPTSMSFIPNSVLKDGAPFPGANPNNGIDLGTVRMNSSVHVVFQAILVSIPPSLQLTNQARAEYSFRSLEGRTVTGSVYSNSVTLNVLPFFVSLIAEVSTNQTFSGDIITYQLLVLNQGSVPITESVIYVPLISGITFVQGSVIIGETHHPSILPEDGIPLGTVAAGASILIKVNLRIGDPVEANPFPLQGYLRYNVDGAAYSALSNELLVYVILPIVKVSKTVDKSRATTGCNLQYECVVRNEGSFAVDATLKDVLPAGLSLVPGSIVMEGQQLDGANLSDGIFLGTVRPDQQASVTFNTLVQQPAISSGPSFIRNQASAAFTFRIPDGRVVRQMSQSDPVSVEVLAPNIKVTAIPAHYVVEPGEELSFTVTLNNTGTLAANLKLVGWFQEPYVLTECGIVIQGERKMSNQGYSLGSLDPGETLRFNYITKVLNVLDEDIEEVNGYFLFTYHTELDQCMHDGEFRSSVISISIDTEDE